MRLPGNAVEFFRQILKIAMLEVLPIGMLYDKHFHFTKTDPINLNFEAVGFESTNFLKNIGSMILPLVFLVVLSIMVIVLYPFRKHRIYKKVKSLLFWEFPIKFLIE